MKILITAFEPFNKQFDNASLEVLNHISMKIDNIEIIKKVLPVTYD